MDSKGNFYADGEAAERLAEQLGEKVKPLAAAPKTAVQITETAAGFLTRMNRRQRRAFWSERRRGAEEDAALTVAQGRR